jgi:hypothetical protein
MRYRIAKRVEASREGEHLLDDLVDGPVVVRTRRVDEVKNHSMKACSLAVGSTSQRTSSAHRRR